MKTIGVIVIVMVISSCGSSLPIAKNPDKSSFNSGTIGSVKATDNLPLSDSGSIYKNDTTVMKRDSLQHHFGQN